MLYLDLFQIEHLSWFQGCDWAPCNFNSWLNSCRVSILEHFHVDVTLGMGLDVDEQRVQAG